MTTKFITTIRHEGLYCVWVLTANPRQPLACIWIDPQFRSGGLATVEQTAARSVSTSQSANKTVVRPGRKARLSTRLVPRNAPPLWRGKGRAVVRTIALVAIALSVLLNPASADVGAVTLTNTGNGTKQTTTNEQGQYSFRVVSVGKSELEISSPGFSRARQKAPT